jgi:hypothetical protein
MTPCLTGASCRLDTSPARVLKYRLRNNSIAVTLIEMGGGTGPVKPGNRVAQLHTNSPTGGAKSVRRTPER